MVDKILQIVSWLLGLFGFGKPPDDAADQRKSDKQAGIDAATSAATGEEVTEIQTAVDARQKNEGGHAGESPDQIRTDGFTDPNARKFDPDAVG